jgi:DNA-binding MarR family transcriptional regulator
MDDLAATTSDVTTPAGPAVDDRLTLMGLLSEISTGLQARIDEDLSPARLTSTEFGVLLRLSRSPGERLRMTDLAAQVNLSNSGLTRLVDRLERAGHLHREACPNDRRGSFAVLTPKGRSLLQRLLPGHVAVLDRWLLAPLSAEDLDAFVATLRVLRDHIAPDAAAGSAADAAAAC